MGNLARSHLRRAGCPERPALAAQMKGRDGVTADIVREAYEAVAPVLARHKGIERLRSDQLIRLVEQGVAAACHDQTRKPR